MEWQVIVALVLAVPVIIFPVAFVWYLNAGGAYSAMRRTNFLVAIGRVLRIALPVIVAVGAYGFIIWFFLGNFGWQLALAVALALPIVLFVPVLVWVAVASGLYQVARDTLRRRAAVPRRRAVRTAAEPVLRKVE